MLHPDLLSVYQSAAYAAPEDMLATALKKEEWRLAASICLEMGDRLTPAKIAHTWAQSVPMHEVYTHDVNALFEPRQPNHYSGLRALPPFSDAWLLGLLKAGLDPHEPLKGYGIARRPWEGSVHALAVLLDAPESLAELARRAPVADWVNEEVIWEGKPTKLLHLALATGRWHSAKFLVDHGFPTHLKDAQGSYPWEHVRGQVEVCLGVLDGIRLWPRDEEEMDEGWKRRGIATTQDEGPKDKAWRLAMIERMGQGSDFELTIVIEHLLKVTESRQGADWKNSPNQVDVVGLWNRLSPEDRQRPVPVRRGLIRGQWSLAGALCWVAAWTDGALSRKMPTGMIVPWEPLPLDILGAVAPTIEEAELDRPIAQRKGKGGETVSLTARGLLGVAHATAERHAHTMGRPTAMGQHLPCPHYLPVTPNPAWAQAALEAWTLMASQVKPTAENALQLFKTTLMDMLKRGHGKNPPLPWDAAFQPLLDVPTRLQLWAQVEKGKGSWEYALWLWDHAPQEPLSPKLLARLPSPLEGVVEGATALNKKARASEWISRGGRRSPMSVLDAWSAWGWTFTSDQVAQLAHDLDTIEAGLGGQVVAQHREKLAATQGPAVSDLTARRPRLRS